MTDVFPRMPRNDSRDPQTVREEIFASSRGPEVFRSVCHRHEIWRDDPFDVDTIHQHARQAFSQLLDDTTQADDESSGVPSPTAGRILLILGESGAGKTHLMRVIRHRVHSAGQGYCGYLQMTSAANDYARYVLCNLIDSLDQPYFESVGDTSGLQQLSNALVEIPSCILKQERDALREDRFNDAKLAQFIRELADLIIEDERFANCDVHLIQALLYLQRKEPRSKSRVLSYLRCEELSTPDREVIGGLVPRTEADRTIEMLGRLMWSLEGKSLIVCVDQLEDMAHLDRDAERFRRAMTAVCSLAERVPSSLFVISCLEDLYPPLKQALTRSYLDRIEHDPEPIRLECHRSWPELVGLVSRRLDVLYRWGGQGIDESQPTFPIAEEQLRPLTNTRTRDILDWCRDFQRAVIRGETPVATQPDLTVVADDTATASDASSVPSTATGSAIVTESESELIRLTQLWNDTLAAHSAATSDDDEVLSEQLSQALTHAVAELPGTPALTMSLDGCQIAAELQLSGAQPMLIGLCNRSPQGGALSRQVKAVLQQTGDRCPVLVRSTEFPDGPRTKIAQQLAEVTQVGGRCVVVEDSDWRAMRTMCEFRSDNSHDPHFAAWLQTERPLTRLKSLRAILAADELLAQGTTEPVRTARKRAA